MKQLTLNTIVTLIVIGLPASPVLAGPAADKAAVKCEAGKLKEAAKYSGCLLKAQSKAKKKGGTPDYSKCDTKLAGKWAKLEDKADGNCPSTGDLDSIKTEINEQAGIIVGCVAGGPCDAGCLADRELAHRLLNEQPNLANLEAPGYDLDYANLTGYDLTDAVLSNATLVGVDLSNATLTNATLTNATLKWANLTGATLTGADLSNTELTQADLSNVSAQYANFLNSDMNSAVLTGADLTDAQFTGAFMRGATLNDADLSGAVLTADLRDTDMTYANLTGASMSGAGLMSADLSGATLAEATLTGADLRATNFTDANLYDAYFCGANTAGTIWSNTVCPDGTNSDTNGAACACQ